MSLSVPCFYAELALIHLFRVAFQDCSTHMRQDAMVICLYVEIDAERLASQANTFKVNLKRPNGY